MEIGISIDTDSIYKYYNTIYQNCDIIKHIQFYLNDEPIDMQRSKIIKFKEDFKFASFSYSIHSYGYINLCEPINRVRKSWIDVALETLLLVNDIQGVFANFHMGFSFSDKVPNDFMLGNLKDSIMELSKYATSKNIFIDLENDFNTNEIIRLGSNINDLNEIISWNLSNTTANFLKACFFGVIDMQYGSCVYGNLQFFSYQLLYIRLSHALVLLPSVSLMELLFLKDSSYLSGKQMGYHYKQHMADPALVAAAFIICHS